MDPVTVLVVGGAVVLTGLLARQVWVGLDGGRAHISEARTDAAETDRRTGELRDKVRSELPGLRVAAGRARGARDGSMRRRFNDLVERANRVGAMRRRQRNSLKQFRQEVDVAVSAAVREGWLQYTETGGLRVAPEVLAADPEGARWALDTVTRFENAQRDAERSGDGAAELGRIVVSGGGYRAAVDQAERDDAASAPRQEAVPGTSPERGTPASVDAGQRAGAPHTTARPARRGWWPRRGRHREAVSGRRGAHSAGPSRRKGRT